MEEKRHKDQGNNTKDKNKVQINSERYSTINNQKNSKHININSNKNPTEKDLSLSEHRTNYYSNKWKIDTSKNYRRSGQKSKIIEDNQLKREKYKNKIEKETPKEKNINYSLDNAYININEKKNEKNTTNTTNTNISNKKLDENIINNNKNNNYNIIRNKYKSNRINDINNNKDNTNNDYKHRSKNMDNIYNNKYNNKTFNKNNKNNIICNTVNIIANEGNNNNTLKYKLLNENNKDNINDKNNNNCRDKINNINNKENTSINNKYNIYKNEISIFNNIKSIYIFKNIFNYIKDNNFQYKLFNYSKLFQKKFNLDINFYQDKYIENKIILLEDIPTEDNIRKFISKEKICIDDLDENRKSKYFKSIKDKYLSIYYKNEFHTLPFINPFQFSNFSKIKKISLIQSHSSGTYGINGKTEILFQSLFSINNLENNLIYLKIFLDFIQDYIVENDLFEKINNFKSLRYLYIRKINFHEITINIKNLNIFYCELCRGIKINECKNIQKLIYISNNLSMLDNILNSDNSKKLNEIDLFNNNISDITILEKIKFDNLEILDLSMNYISNINFLENDHFKNLKILNLYNNGISNIKILEKVKFEKLEELYLADNNISRIDVLFKSNFKDLKILDLSKNKISSIDALEKVKFENLEILNLSRNKISSFNTLEKVKFKNLKILNLSRNNISSINALEKVKFENLEILFLTKQIIYSDKYPYEIKISFDFDKNFPKLKELNFNGASTFEDLKELAKLINSKIKIS